MQIGVYWLLTIIFVTLKVLGLIGWSWLWVLSPLWISFLVWLLFYVGFIALATHLGGCR